MVLKEKEKRIGYTERMEEYKERSVKGKGEGEEE